MSSQKLCEEREETKLKKGYTFTKYRQSRNLQGIKVRPLLGDEYNQEQGIPGIAAHSQLKTQNNYETPDNSAVCAVSSSSELHRGFRVSENFEIIEDGLIGGVFNSTTVQSNSDISEKLGNKANEEAEMEKSVSISEWCFVMVLSFIPIVNVLASLVFAFFPRVNKNLKNFSMSFLICGTIFVLLATFILTLASLMFPESVLFKYKYFI